MLFDNRHFLFIIQILYDVSIDTTQHLVMHLEAKSVEYDASIGKNRQE